MDYIHVKKKRLPSLEFILKTAIAERLPDLIEGRHPKFPAVDKVEILKLCDVLRKAEYLQIYLQPDTNGFPLPAYGDYINVTVQGRDYLKRIRQNKLWRRALGWGIAFLVGILTPMLVDWLRLLMKLFAKNHGLNP